ncbi:MAG TPA: glycosyltransferase family 10 [Syntrophomonadaceae bacterium]|nr:glycosyltransferase family 10 [Syntrophomonadaceae bacterium]HPR94412.1 glycosyltransferase family 10 [Syntrophomonadaceae bacterium]
MKRKITVDFTDDWEGFKKEDNIYIKILRERYEVEISEDPDYLFHFGFGWNFLKYDRSIRVFLTGECLLPDFNVSDYALAHAYLDYGDRYMRFPVYTHYGKDYGLAMKKHQVSEEMLKGKTKFCNFVYSNPIADIRRQQFFELLNSYKPVESGGRFLNNIGGPVGDKLEFQKLFKFSIAFENSTYPGYVTEKILQAFAASTVPIYWGDPLIGTEFNEKSFINCHAYKDFHEVIEVVKRIDADDELFRSYIREPIWKNSSDEQEQWEKRVRAFLFHIIDQPFEEAFRRNTVLWGRIYETRLMKLYKLQNNPTAFVLRGALRSALRFVKPR